VSSTRRHWLAAALLAPTTGFGQGAAAPSAAASTAPAPAAPTAPGPGGLRPGSIDPATRRRILSDEPGEPGSPRVAPSSVIANLGGRPRQALDGRWHYVLDPFDAARRKTRDRRSVWRDQIEQPGQTIVEYEWDTSPQLKVPGDWNTQAAELLHYQGTAYFRRRFEAASPRPGRRVFLAFDAVSYRSTVWLNGQRLGGHEGGYTPFSFEVTTLLKAGRNVLVVRADNRHDDESLPAADFDWHNYGGITRSVWLAELPAIFVRHWSLRLEGEAGPAQRLVGTAQLDGSAAVGTPLVLEIAALGLRAEVQADGAGRARWSLPVPAALERWSPERPILYDVVLSVGRDEAADVQRDRIGFRTLATRGSEVLLNGRPVFLRGISLHEEPLGAAGGRRVGDAEARALLQSAKDLGCNFVRLAHYPHGEAMLRVADAMGLLVWSEIPVYWEDVSYASAKTLALARTMFTEMIERDANRASVVMWSVANETPEIASRHAFLKDVVAHVRALDPSRLITAALNKNADIDGTREGQKAFVVDDPLGEVLDVIGVNQYEAWYSNLTPEQLSTVSFRSRWAKPLIVSEFGADAPLGYRADKAQRWSEDFQAHLYEHTLRMVDRIPGLAGVTPWVLKDFRSPRRWHGRFQQNWNRKGVISEDGQRKLAFDVLRRWYAGKTP
jgi:beta-glucuronidase